MVVLVRYGAIPEVARFTAADAADGAAAGAAASAAAGTGPDAREAGEAGCRRGDRVVVETHRGLLMGEVLQTVAPPVEPPAPDTPPPAPSGRIVRAATADDRIDEHAGRAAAAASFADWTDRIARWGIEVELLDVEHSLDRVKTTLYVLCGRDAETTKLALQAAAAGLGVIDVQPVTADGVVPPQPSGGGCGSCGH